MQLKIGIISNGNIENGEMLVAVINTLNALALTCAFVFLCFLAVLFC